MHTLPITAHTDVIIVNHVLTAGAWVEPYYYFFFDPNRNPKPAGRRGQLATI